MEAKLEFKDTTPGGHFIIFYNVPTSPITFSGTERRIKQEATKCAKQWLGLEEIKGKWEDKDFGFVRWHFGLCLKLTIVKQGGD